MNQSEVALKFGVSRQAVAARVKKHGSLEAADEALSQSLRPETASGPAKDRYAEARTRKMIADALLSEMEADQRAGKLVEVARVMESQRRVTERIRSMFDGRRSDTCAKLGGAPSDRQDAMWQKVHDEIFSELGRPLA